MNCDQAREELELGFGSDELSEEVTRHLNECADCRAYREQLLHLAAGLGEDLDVDFSSAEIERAVHNVERRIAPAPVVATKVTRLSWWRPVLRFAAAAMIVLVAYGSYEFGKSRVGGEYTESTPSSDTGYGSATAFLQSDDESEMDDDMVSVLINEYSAGTRMGADEALLGDITPEELEYLKENLQVGELL